MQQFKESKEKKKSKVTILKAFKTIIWPRRKLVFIGLFLILISRLAGFVLPLKSKELLDEIVPNKDMDSLYGAFNTSNYFVLIN